MALSVKVDPDLSQVNETERELSGVKVCLVWAEMGRSSVTMSQAMDYQIYFIFYSESQKKWRSMRVAVPNMQLYRISGE